MKKWLLIFSLFLLPGIAAFSQNDSTGQEGGKILERMKEYVQKNLGLSKTESEKFSPVFMRYCREFVQTHRENKGDILILRQKIIELRIRYRTEFRQILDEQRANKVFQYEDKFRVEVKRIVNESRRDRIPPRQIRALLLR
jgi:hypothetical protein